MGRLCRYIQTASTGTAYHVKFVNDIWTACAVDVNNMERRSRRGRVGKHFLKAAEGPIVLAARANVHMDGSSVARRNLEYFENLQIACPWRVSRAQADRNCAALQALFNPSL